MKQKKILKKRISNTGTALLLAVSLCMSMTGCKKDKKEEKPEPKTAVKVDDGNTNASKSGDGQSDAPFVIGSDRLTGNFNPFTAETETEQQVVGLTQAKLVQTDRSGKALYHGIDGEYREYKGEHYTYYGTSDLEVSYDAALNQTKYHITLRKDLVFSDREVLNADDVIFTLYALCDKSYTGTAFRIKDMPIKGLTDYLADSTKAEAFSEKKVKQYMKKNPEKLKKWIGKYIIKRELTQGLKTCEENYAAAGYETGVRYFTEKYQLPKKESAAGKKSLLKKAVSYYQKKGFRALAKAAYSRSDYFDAKVMRQARIFMASGKGKKVSDISGIVRVNDFELEITTNGYDRRMTGALDIPICPLHYYGDKRKYHYEKKQFGFRRGDISSVQANKAMPMGAGAYRYIKLEDGVAYFTSNELYFLGCPKTAFVQIKEMPDILVETAQQIKKKQVEEQQETTKKSEEPEPTVNPSAEITELTEGTVDMICGDFSGEKLQWIIGANENQELSGKTVETRWIGDENYFYLGIHAGNVAVGKNAKSPESKALRRAIATVFSFSREALLEENGDSVLLPNYPVLEELWVVPSGKEEKYEIAYNEDADGEYIYDAEEDMEEKSEEVKEAVLGCFARAGYTVDGQNVTGAPTGGKLEFELRLPAGEENLCFAAVKRAVEMLGEMGITIQVKKADGEKALSKYLKKGKQELWISCKSGTEADLLERYGNQAAKRIFGYQDSSFEENLKRLEGFLHVADRKKEYQNMFRKIFDGVLEVPMCETRKAMLFSSARIVRKTIPKEISIYYSPVREIQKLEMK